MTEEQGTARTRLESALDYPTMAVVNAVLDNLPLVMEAAREAGKAERCQSDHYDMAWRLLSDPEEQT